MENNRKKTLPKKVVLICLGYSLSLGCSSIQKVTYLPGDSYSYRDKKIISVTLKRGDTLMFDNQGGTYLEEKSDSGLMRMIRGTDYSGHRISTDISEAFVIKCDRIDTSYLSTYLLNTFVFGASLGYPSNINLIGGYYWRRIGFRVEIGISGLQADGICILSRSKNMIFEVGIAATAIKFSSAGLGGGGSSSWQGVGPFCAFNIGGLFIEAGFTIGQQHSSDPKANSNIHPMFQIGYVH